MSLDFAATSPPVTTTCSSAELPLQDVSHPGYTVNLSDDAQVPLAILRVDHCGIRRTSSSGRYRIPLVLSRLVTDTEESLFGENTHHIVHGNTLMVVDSTLEDVDRCKESLKRLVAEVEAEARLIDAGQADVLERRRQDAADWSHALQQRAEQIDFT